MSTTVLIPVSVPHYYNDTWRGHHPQGPVFLSLTSEGGPVGWGWLQSPFQTLLPSTQAAPPGSAEVLPPQPGCAGYSGAVPLTEMGNNNLVRAARGAGSGHHSESKKRMCVVESVHQSPLIWTGVTAPHTYRGFRHSGHTGSKTASPSAPSCRLTAAFAWYNS